VTFKVYAVDGVTTSSGDIGLAQAKTKPVDIGVMVHVSHPSVTVPPHARVNEQFTVDVPHNATPGDHVGGIIASITEALNGGKVAREDRVGVAMYLRVHGPLHPLLNIESVSTTGYHGTPNPFGGGSTSVSYTVHNTGNVRLSADQAVSVTGLFGIPLATVHPTSPAELLPGGSVRVTARLNGVFPLAPLGLHVKVTPKPVPGSPKPTVPLTPKEYSVGLTAMPWTQLVLLVVLIACGAGLYRWLRGRRRRQADAVGGGARTGQARGAGTAHRRRRPLVGRRRTSRHRAGMRAVTCRTYATVH
jgi:hypothetical protein